MEKVLNRRIWISHSSISDFEKCPKLYYFRNIYRDPENNHKIQVVNPYLTLGTLAHRAIEELRKEPAEKRLKTSLIEIFERKWRSWSGKTGGFVSLEEEDGFKSRGVEMMRKLENSPLIGSPNYTSGQGLPKVRLFKQENIVLVGNIDWVEVLPGGGFHIIDFKTGRIKEGEDSLQLPIYFILGHYNFKKPIEKVSYWYLDKDDKPLAVVLEPFQKYIPVLRQKALAIKKAIDENCFDCKSSSGACFDCRKYRDIVFKKAEYVGFDREMNRDLYFI